AGAAGQRVVAGVAGERVGAAVARDDVGEGIAGAGDVAAADQREVLDEAAQGEACRALHQIGAALVRLGDRVAGGVDQIGVVAGAAAQCVDLALAAAAQDVGGDVAGDDVAAVIAGAVEGGGAEQHQSLLLGTEDERDRTLDRVDPVVGAGIDAVAGDVDPIEIVAGAAAHAVGSGTADERVVALVAAQRVAAAHPAEAVAGDRADDDVGDLVADAADRRTSQRQPLDIRTQGVAHDRALDEIGAAAAGLVRRVLGVIDEVGVVTPTAQ